MPLIEFSQIRIHHGVDLSKIDTTHDAELLEYLMEHLRYDYKGNEPPQNLYLKYKAFIVFKGYTIFLKPK